MIVQPHSDLHPAVLLDGKATIDLYETIENTCRDVVGPVRCDLGFLNNADTVYRFETLKGRLLFTRDEDTWLKFYSLICREYEKQMVHYERQLRYRIEASGEF